MNERYGLVWMAAMTHQEYIEAPYNWDEAVARRDFLLGNGGTVCVEIITYNGTQSRQYKVQHVAA